MATYHGPIPGYGNAQALVVDDSGSVYVTGSSANTLDPIYGFPRADYVTIKYDVSGTEKWKTIYNGPSGKDDYPQAIGLDHSNNVYVTGTSGRGFAGFDIATVKYGQDESASTCVTAKPFTNTNSSING